MMLILPLNNNCRGGPPWPPMPQVSGVSSNGWPRRATPTVAPEDQIQ
jgi:hypothetical protein